MVAVLLVGCSRGCTLDEPVAPAEPAPQSGTADLAYGLTLQFDDIGVTTPATLVSVEPDRVVVDNHRLVDTWPPSALTSLLCTTALYPPPAADFFIPPYQTLHF